MAKYESQLEREDTQLMARFGWHKEKGTADGSGDSVYIKRGRVFYVERKRPRRKQQANQVQFEKFITEQNGTHYYVVDAKDRTKIREILLVEEFYNGFSTLKPPYYETYTQQWKTQ